MNEEENGLNYENEYKRPWIRAKLQTQIQTTKFDSHQ